MKSFKKPFLNLTAAGLFGLLALVGATAQATDVVLNLPNWRVHRSVDPMTDKVICLGINQKNIGVAISVGVMYVKIPGGPQSATFRFGNNPAQETQLPDETEKRISSIRITGANFKEAVSSERMRGAFQTYGGYESLDLNIAGIAEAYAAIIQGCPLPTIKPVPSKLKGPKS